ncbi:MAG: VWA domain-containing protein [Polyangiaceae bacterium]
MSQDDPRSAALVRWRLVLGDSAEEALGGSALSDADAAADAALSWLYDRSDEEGDARDLRGSDRSAGLGPSQLTVPAWINEVHRLFPKETVERLERDAVEKYKIHEVVTSPEVLRRATPNLSLLRAVLHTKHLMSPEVLAMARELVAKVVKKLIEELALEIKRVFHGTKNRRRSNVAMAKNFDAKSTIRKNLDTWDPERKRIGIRKPLFVSRVRRHFDKWQLIILVDESGSMLGSVIHSAVTAACLWGLPSVKTHLAIFDTEVVDLTGSVTDPVEVLMKVQLGGGTDIAKAVAYGASLVENPRRTIFVVVSDFFEGGSAARLVAQVRSLCEAGATVLGLAALDDEAAPVYDRDLAARLVEAGAHVGAMTPGELVSFIAEKVRR